MRRSIATLLLLAVVAVSGACASGGSSSNSGARGPRNAAITAQQARETGAANAYDVVQSLRPTWLRVRGSQSVNSPTGIVVYLDDTRLGGLEALRQISTPAIVTIEYLDPSAAQFRWGTGHAQGAILVKTR